MCYKRYHFVGIGHKNYPMCKIINEVGFLKKCPEFLEINTNIFPLNGPMVEVNALSFPLFMEMKY